MRFQSGKKPRSVRPQTTDILSKGSEMEKCFFLPYFFFPWCFSLAEHKHVVGFSWTKTERRGVHLHGAAYRTDPATSDLLWSKNPALCLTAAGGAGCCWRLVNIVGKPCVWCFDQIHIWSTSPCHPKVSSGFHLADIAFSVCFIHTSSLNCYFCESGCFPGTEKLISVCN